MTEEFLHYVWQFRMYSTQLKLISGEDVQVIDPGTWNRDSGPDFFNARVRISDTLWAGNVEIHVTSSDWFRHRHQFDRAYDTVILHVVYRFDKESEQECNSALPVLQLKDHIQEGTWQRYLQLMASKKWIPCEMLIPQVAPLIWHSWQDRLLVERMERKALLVEKALTVALEDWNQAFYRLLARNMGFKLNNEAFEWLSTTISYQCLWRHADQLIELEALVFGQAGMLDRQPIDSYHAELKILYQHFQRKYDLQSMDEHLWRFMRLHPHNFPTVRLAQFAAFMHHSQGLMMKLLETEHIVSIRALLNVSVSDYWQTHYRFGREVRSHKGNMGETAVNLLLINFFVPFMLVYAARTGKAIVRERAWQLLENIEAEDNAIIRKWKSYGVPVKSASQSQSLLELKSYYCDRKKCLNCRIGMSVLKNE